MKNTETNNSQKRSYFSKIFFFDIMIAPMFITWLFVLTVIINLIVGVFMPYTIYGILYIVISILMSRIFFEMIMVMFKINTNIQKLVDNKENN